MPGARRWLSCSFGQASAYLPSFIRRRASSKSTCAVATSSSPARAAGGAPSIATATAAATANGASAGRRVAMLALVYSALHDPGAHHGHDRHADPADREGQRHSHRHRAREGGGGHRQANRRREVSRAPEDGEERAHPLRRQGQRRPAVRLVLREARQEDQRGARVSDAFGKVSQAPTNPSAAGGAAAGRATFDVADLYRGPLGDASGAPAAAGARLDEKLRQAYFWIVNSAIINPFYDVEYDEGAPPAFTFGDAKARLTLPTAQSYSSFVLLPLLNLAVRRRCLLVGGPGRGKTASAVIMGVLAGYALRDVKRAIQHGQPQMTITDLLGSPLPKDLVSADSTDDIRIAWRRWLGMRVKIIDEYNRIPTRTQSALLTVMADNYAEVFDQIYECPEAAWYLTANDDAGGGTYDVIEALRDRIDVVVKAQHFNPRLLGELLERIEAGVKPEE